MKEEKNGLSEKVDKLISRIDVLINIALKYQVTNQKVSIREQIGFLNSLGLNYKDIAGIFGKSPSYISSELTLLKKKNGGKQNG
jgi:hypothetical protein